MNLGRPETEDPTMELARVYYICHKSAKSQRKVFIPDASKAAKLFPGAHIVDARNRAQLAYDLLHSRSPISEIVEKFKK